MDEFIRSTGDMRERATELENVAISSSDLIQCAADICERLEALLFAVRSQRCELDIPLPLSNIGGPKVGVPSGTPTLPLVLPDPVTLPGTAPDINCKDESSP